MSRWVAPYSNSETWCNRLNARTILGLSQDRNTLDLFTVGAQPGGMTVEAADLLTRIYTTIGNSACAPRHPATAHFFVRGAWQNHELAGDLKFFSTMIQ